jgi:hypothetical protein
MYSNDNQIYNKGKAKTGTWNFDKLSVIIWNLESGIWNLETGTSKGST